MDSETFSETTIIYNEGDIVWVKLGSTWWPGEVKSSGNLPPEVEFKKPPLVIVKFFEEDTFEYVKSWSNVCPYNCDKKVEFIKKGMAAFRNNVPHMQKFPKDVSNAEVLVGGNPNILSEPIFLPEKRRHYSSDEEGTSRKGKSPKIQKEKKARPKISKPKSHITHRRFLGCNDYRAFICIQSPEKDRIPGDKEDDEVILLNTEPEQEFKCYCCCFTSKRLEVMIIHMKFHGPGVETLDSKKKRPLTTKVKKEKAKKPRASSSKDSHQTSREKEHSRQKKSDESSFSREVAPSVSEVDVEERPKNPSDIRENLLAEWDISDDEVEESFNTQSTSVTESQNSITEITDMSILDESCDKKSESDSDVDDKNTTIDDSITNPTEVPEANNSSGSSAEKSLTNPAEVPEANNSSGSSAEESLTNPTEVPEANNSSGSSAEETPKAKKIDQDTQQAIKSCFDFDEEDEEETPVIIPTAVTGRKIPRVIPLKRSSDLDESYDKMTEENESIDDVSETNVENDNTNDKIENAKEVTEITSKEIDNCTKMTEEINTPNGENDRAIKENVDIENVIQENENTLENTLNLNNDANEVIKEGEFENAFNELMETTSVPDFSDIHNTLKCEQNFHGTKTIKFPDKPEDDKPLSKNVDTVEKSEPSEVATKLTNPKKRFAKSFEDFELNQHVKRNDESHQSEAEGTENIENAKNMEVKSEEKNCATDFLKLKSRMMSKIIQQAAMDEESKASSNKSKDVDTKNFTAAERKSSSYKQTPRSKILESYFNETMKERPEQSSTLIERKDEGCSTSHSSVPHKIEKCEGASSCEITDKVSPKKKLHSRISHPKKDRTLLETFENLQKLQEHGTKPEKDQIEICDVKMKLHEPNKSDDYSDMDVLGLVGDEKGVVGSKNEIPVNQTLEELIVSPKNSEDDENISLQKKVDFAETIDSTNHILGENGSATICTEKTSTFEIQGDHAPQNDENQMETSEKVEGCEELPSCLNPNDEHKTEEAKDYFCFENRNEKIASSASDIEEEIHSDLAHEKLWAKQNDSLLEPTSSSRDSDVFNTEKELHEKVLKSQIIETPCSIRSLLTSDKEEYNALEKASVCLPDDAICSPPRKRKQSENISDILLEKDSDVSHTFEKRMRTHSASDVSEENNSFQSIDMHSSGSGSDAKTLEQVSECVNDLVAKVCESHFNMSPSQDHQPDIIEEGQDLELNSAIESPAVSIHGDSPLKEDHENKEMNIKETDMKETNSFPQHLEREKSPNKEIILKPDEVDDNISKDTETSDSFNTTSCISEDKEEESFEKGESSDYTKEEVVTEEVVYFSEQDTIIENVVESDDNSLKDTHFVAKDTIESTLSFDKVTNFIEVSNENFSNTHQEDNKDLERTLDNETKEEVPGSTDPNINEQTKIIDKTDSVNRKPTDILLSTEESDSRYEKLDQCNKIEIQYAENSDDNKFSIQTDLSNIPSCEIASTASEEKNIAPDVGLRNISPNVGTDNILKNLTPNVGNDSILKNMSPNVGTDSILKNISPNVGADNILKNVSSDVAINILPIGNKDKLRLLKEQEDSHELVTVEGNLTVVSEMDLAEGQVEITPEQIISPKKVINPSSIYTDFSDSTNDSSSTNDTLSDNSKGFDSRGTEFTSKAILNEVKSAIGNKKVNTYGRTELLDILEGKEPYAPKKSIIEDFCDFEDHIPSQIVCATRFKQEKEEIIKDIREKSKSKKNFKIASTATKLLERLTEIKKDTNKTAKNEKVESIVKQTPSPNTKLGRLKQASSKPIILSEQIIKPASSAQTPKPKKALDDIEDVEAFIIHKDLKKSKCESSSVEVTDQKHVEKKSKGNKILGKAKILQQTIITPSGEIIQPAGALPQSDENIFDINSMPIVLSDQILTPENIEQMPIVLSSDTSTTSNVIKQTNTVSTAGKLSTENKTVTKPRSSMSPAVTQATSKSINLVPKTSRTPRILQTSANRIIQRGSPLLSNTSKPGKYILVPQSSTVPTVPPAKGVVKKMTLKKSPTPQNKANNGSEVGGNKIMILTNQQGQQQRLLLTPAQQKLLGCQTQGSRAPKTVIKGSIAQSNVALSKKVITTTSIDSSSNVGSKNAFSVGQTLLITNTPIVGDQHIISHTSNPGRITKTGRIHIGNQKTNQNASKVAQTLVLKNQHAVKKVQGSDEDLDKQVAEKLEAIKASSGITYETQVKPSDSIKSSTKNVLKGSKKIDSKGNFHANPVEKYTTKSNEIVSRTLLPLSAKQSSLKEPVVLPKAAESKIERPLNQLVIQDAVGNQTTITEGQILALPSETVDGQPQSYMLVTLDQSGNLTPLNNEALMSLDPNLGLGGDISNMVLQIEPGSLTNPGIQHPPPLAQSAVMKSNKESTSSVEPLSRQNVSKIHALDNTEPPLLIKPKVPNVLPANQNVEQTLVPHTSSESGQQLIISGDPIATQKFLESLTEGTTDLANLLASAEGNGIIIHTDGQQILINTDCNNQMLLSVNNDNTSIHENNESNGNPIFATQPNKSQDILAAALADTDVFQQEHPPSQGKFSSQLSPNNSLYPINVGNVLETSLTLSSPIMTPLEVPSTNNKKIPDEEADILTRVPKNVDLPITITDPNISQTVANQQVASFIASELQTNLELALPISETSISVSKDIHSPSYSYALPTLDESVDITHKTFSSSMPLLNEDTEPSLTGLNKVELDHKKYQISSDEKNQSAKENEAMVQRGSFLADDDDEEKGRFTLGREMCSSLSEPPPEMFDLADVNSSFGKTKIPSSLQSTPDSSERAKEDELTDLSTQAESSNDGSCEIPVQPKIIAKSQNLDLLNSD